ncbi:MAG: DUF5667 domain-containing protein [bacterium]|nr:DUF5667 domain-containing protein [bacterium]
MLASIIIGFIIALGIGGTVVVADNARPGDALFGIDRGVENVRISLALKENKDDLRIKFAEERIREVKELKEEEDLEKNKSSEDNHARTVEAAAVAKIFLENVALQIGTSTNASTTAQIQNIINQFNIQADEIEKLRVDLKKGELKVRVDTDEGRVRIEVKDGKVEIKSKSNNSGRGSNSNFDNDTATSSNPQNNATSTRSVIEIEADVFTDITTVKVEINDVKTTFTTGAKNRDDIKKAIIERFPLLTSAQIEAVLNLEIENRASRPQDMD